MTTISKNVFSRVAGNKTCAELIHPWTTNCPQEWMNYFYGFAIGSGKFFTVIYALQFCVRGRRNAKKYLKEQLLLFPWSWLYGASMGSTLLVMICLTRRLLGRFYYYSAVLLPGICAGLMIFLENNAMKLLNSILFFNMVLEAAVRLLTNDGVLIRSTAVDTAVFMLTNAVFMYLLSGNQAAYKVTLLWFFDPKRPKPSDQSGEKCCETIWCRKHIVQDSLKYFGLGYGFQTFKSVLPGLLALLRKPRKLLSAIVNKNALKLGMFMGSYVLIYKMVCRELYALTGANKPKHSLLAGLLAGTSYAFQPNLGMALMPVTLTLQILWLNIRTMYKLPEWPYKELLFALCTGILFHCRFVRAESCPRYIINVMATVTNGTYLPALKNFEKVLQQSLANL